MLVRDFAAMVINKNLVIADVHLGLTKELYESGIVIPLQWRTLAERVNRLKAQTKTTRLVILGDVKHRIPTTSWQEYREVPLFFNALDFKRIIVTKGNHDGNVEELLALTEKNVRVVTLFTAGDYACCHGHMNIHTKKRNIIIGHNHPKVIFRDRFGAIYVEQVWVKGSAHYDGATREVLIVPSFNELAGSAIINDPHGRTPQPFQGPIARHLTASRAYLLDGTDLGFVNDLALKSATKRDYSEIDK